MTPARPLPKLAFYLWSQGLSAGAYARALGAPEGAGKVSREHIRRLILPFGDPARRYPSRKLKARIEAESGGFVSAGDWDAPFAPQTMDNAA